MADNKKKPQTLQQKLDAASARNVQGLGWNASDFGIRDVGGLNNPTLAPIADGVQEGQNVQPSNVVNSNTPATSYTTPQERQKFKASYNMTQEEVNAASGPFHAGASFLGRLFDTTDPVKENIAESVWDGAWGFVNGVYNTINATTVAGISALPGGTRTLTYKEAGDVSVFQELAASATKSATKIKTGEGNLWDILSLTPLSALALDENNPLSNPNFDVTDPAQKKAAFQDNAVNKWTTGLGDAAFTIFADPFIAAGKFAKMGRLRYLDRTFQGEAGRALLKQELEYGAGKITEATATGIAPKISPAAQFVHWATEKAPDSSAKMRTASEIFNHPFIQRASNRELISSALYHADDYDTASLIMRYAYNDLDAGKELFNKQAAIVDGMGKAQRDRVMTMMALDPGNLKQAQKIARTAASKAQTRLDELETANMQGTNEWQMLTKARDNAQQTLGDLTDLKPSMLDPFHSSTPENIAISKQIYKNLEDQNVSLRNALADEYSRVGGVMGSFEGSVRGMPSDTAFGRWAEGSRERRAIAKTEAAATRGARVETGKTITRPNGTTAKELRRLHLWESDVYGNNGFTRAVRLWRWAGEENPAGFITTKGIGAQESWREVNAVLNDVNVYSGNARTITQTKKVKDATGKWIDAVDESGKPIVETIQVGGIERKQQLLTEYMTAVSGGTAGSEAAQLALDHIEKAIFNDISAWHGIPKALAKELRSKADATRSKTLESMRDDRAFWVDPDSNVVNKMPWLESHIQNGTYMHNYRALEKQARMYDETGWIKTADDMSQWTGDKLLHAYSIFNDFWRPMTLMRLGYTMRNVTEGWARASAFTFSLKPVAYGMENMGYSARNLVMKRVNAKAADKAISAARLRSAGQQGIPMPAKYTEWLGREIQARDLDIANSEHYLATNGSMIADASPRIRDFAVSHVQSVKTRLVEQLNESKKLNASTSEIDAIRAEIKYYDDMEKQMSSITVFTGETEAALMSLDSMQTVSRMLVDSYGRRAALDNETIAATMFQQQGQATMRKFNGNFGAADDPRPWNEAFSVDSGYSPVALSNASSDATYKSMLMLQSEGMNHSFRAVRMKHYVDVAPGEKGYWDGYAAAIRQIKSSDLGQRAIRGDSVEDIAKWLQYDQQGRETANFLLGAINAKPSKGGLRGKNDPRFKLDEDTALDMAQRAVTRYQSLAASDEAQQFFKAVVVDENFSGKTVQAALGMEKDGKYVIDLPHVVGSLAEEFGMKSVMDFWRGWTQTAMKVLGSMPEDAFVRNPFYGMRYRSTLDALIKDVKDQVGDTISIREIDAMERIAHRRALKDTKDWLYTIDRRTNLGTYGEMLVPFISAAQNGLTTVGRLVYNDPSIAAIGALLWQAPNRMGMEDGEGNIIIPIPHDWIPDGIEQALGIDEMKNLKVGKSSLNNIVPESGFGFIPRPGPLVGVPASEIMKHGFFGISVESPGLMRTFLGKEKADAVWNAWKSYLFGEEGGVAKDTFSLSMFVPPMQQKILQYFQKEGNTTYAYAYEIQRRAEEAKYFLGERDTRPTKDEIINKTGGFTILKMLGNVFAYTPPQYESTVDNLSTIYRYYQQQYGPDADKFFNQQFGTLAQMLGDVSMSKNVAGAQASADSVEFGRKYQTLLSGLAPSLKASGDISSLGMLLNKDAKYLYDPSAYGWQFSNVIPGTNTVYREQLSPAEAQSLSEANAGWSKWLKAKEQIDAELAATGYKSLDYVPSLKAKYDAFMSDMANNPLYHAWFIDYSERSTARTINSVNILEAALNDQQFMSDNGSDPKWQAAAIYLQERAKVRTALLQSGAGETITNIGNSGIKQYWDGVRADLATRVPTWGAFANRYLDGDSNPVNPGVQFGTEIILGGING